LKKLADELKGKGLRIGGFLSEVVLEGPNVVGYDLFDLRDEMYWPFIRKQGKEGWQRIGSYFFIPESLAHAKTQILQSKDRDILVVDEVGPLELREKGLWPAVRNVLSSPPRMIILVVRKSIMKDFLDLVKGQEIRIFDIQEEGTFSRMKEEIGKNL
jgi:nucleoside-triphosphatase THEP1